MVSPDPQSLLHVFIHNPTQRRTDAEGVRIGVEPASVMRNQLWQREQMIVNDLSAASCYNNGLSLDVSSGPSKECGATLTCESRVCWLGMMPSLDDGIETPYQRS